ncbi:very low-density lipoprotein receptor [Plakobranchus ocellatus]|uniref:Very low-density lipoprotein receptor n=1 Tax=Plakobranchus ocellatus TaxID=259542 RepID=A0AAV4DZ69_9GAST|nr:very low-density lipoprotein receptor [Plakobranchus ocellatus]
MRQEEVSTAEIFKKGALSAIERRAAGESTIMAMVSLSTLTRGVFNGQIDKDSITISRVILGKSGIMSRPEIELLFEHLNYLYYQCPSDGRSVSSRTIPLSQICDGTVDCPTGDDEDSCSGLIDISCSPTQFSCKSGQCVP